MILDDVHVRCMIKILRLISMKKFLLYISLFSFLFACQTTVKGPKTVMQKAPVVKDTFAFTKYNYPDFTQNTDNRFNIYLVAKKNTEFHFGPQDSDYGKYDTIPLVEDSRFDYYVRLFTKNYRRVFQKWLDRSNEYIYIIRDILRREGVPEELVYLPLAESGFNPSIRSRAGACGMWQFMKGTGKIYGLDTNFWVDERRDFEKSTVAAAKHLKDLHDRLGNWYLAIAAYNAGLGKILKAERIYHTKDFYKMAQRRRRYLKPETKDYVPKYLALRYLARNYQEYGFDTPDGKPQLFQRVTLYRQANLYVIASLIDTDIDTLREMNPELMTPMTPPVDEYSLRVPYGKKDELEDRLEHITDDELAQFHVVFARRGKGLAGIAKHYHMSSRELKKINGLRHNVVLRSTYLFIPIKKVYDKELNSQFVQELKRYNPKVHIVHRGENLYAIAHKYGMSLYELMALNRGINYHTIRPGQSIIVSDSYYNSRRSRHSRKRYARYKHHSSGSYAKRTHKVRSGESLWSIANRYGTTVAQIKKTNHISGSVIHAGRRLVVYDYRSKKTSSDNSKYTVRDGDNLWTIAKRFGTSVSRIKEKNNLPDNNIQPGNVLELD